jgi:hypothetical protein
MRRLAVRGFVLLIDMSRGYTTIDQKCPTDSPAELPQESAAMQ